MKRQIPQDVLAALADGDWHAAAQALFRHASKQSDHFEIKYRRGLDRLEQVFREIHRNRDPWPLVTASDRQTYRQRIARYIDLLGMEHLIADIRACKDAQSLKYFIVPKKDKVCRWEDHVDRARERRYLAESAAHARELEEVADLVLGEEKPVAATVPEWVEKSRRELVNCFRRNDVDECRSITAKLKFHGYNVHVATDNTITVTASAP